MLFTSYNPFTGNSFDNQRVMWDFLGTGNPSSSASFANPIASQSFGTMYNLVPQAYAASGGPQSSTPSTQAGVPTPTPPSPTAPGVGTAQAPQLNQQQQQQQQTGSYQQQWQDAGHAGTAPAGYHGEGGGQSTSDIQNQINQQINDTYNANNDFINQQEAQVNANYPTVQADITGQYNSAAGQLGTTNAADLQTYGTQADQASHLNENALAQARQAYSDALTGYQQKFGGASSAGEALSAYANRSAQQQMGGINTNYQNTTQQINNSKTNTTNQYNQNMLAIQTSRDASLNQANRDFQNSLLQIGNSRVQNEQAKGQQRLQALQDLRNTINAANVQANQNAFTLQAQANYSGLQLQNYQAMSGQNNSAASASLNNFNNYAYNPTASYSQVQSTPQSSQPLTGSIQSSQPNYQLYPTNGYSY